MLLLSTKKEGCARKPALFWFTSEKQLLYAFPTKYLRRAGFAEGKWGGDEQTFKTDSIGQIHSLATSMQVFRLPRQKLRFFLNRCLRALPLRPCELVCLCVCASRSVCPGPTGHSFLQNHFKFETQVPLINAEKHFFGFLKKVIFRFFTFFLASDDVTTRYILRKWG